MRYEDPDEATADEDLGIDIEDDGNDSTPIESAPEPVQKPEQVQEKAGPPEHVPYKRLQEVVSERNRARDAAAEKDREIAELKAKLVAPVPEKPDTTLADRIRAQHSALLRGDEEEAERIGMELETIREERATNAAIARMDAKAAKVANEAQEGDANAAAIALIEAHDVLNSESDKFDPELFEDFKSLADRYAKTMTVADAFKAAEKRLLGTPVQAAAKQGNSKAFANAKIAERMPPSLSSAGRSNANAAVAQFSAQSIRNMSDKTFIDLPKEDLDVLLGNA